MSSKTKIVVLHTKEVIYTGIFVVLAVVLAVLLFLMFGKNKNADPASADAIYHAGVYTSPITSVSYTHLDVYKRQTCNRRISPSSPIRKEGSKSIR